MINDELRGDFCVCILHTSSFAMIETLTFCHSQLNRERKPLVSLSILFGSLGPLFAAFDFTSSRTHTHTQFEQPEDGETNRAHEKNLCEQLTDLNRINNEKLKIVN